MSDRVQLAARVPESVKNRYENKIAEVYGTVRPWAATELERELRTQFGLSGGPPRGVSSDPEHTRKKLVRSESVTSDSIVVNYRIHPDVRNELSDYCDETGTHMGHFLGNVMISIANSLSDGGDSTSQEPDGGVVTEPPQTDETASPEVPDPTDDLPTHEAVATRLESDHQFSYTDFCDAWEAVDGEQPTKHKVDKYLPRVLDILDYTWFETENGANSELYMPESEAPDTRDIRTKPYVLMDRDDLRDFAAICALQGGLTPNGKMRRADRREIGDGLENVTGATNPGPKKIRKAMERAAEEYTPVTYTQNDGSRDPDVTTVLVTEKWGEDDAAWGLLDRVRLE